MKLSLYLETSVIGAYLDNGDPFRRDLTIRWFEHELSEYQVYSSILVQRELERIDEPHRTGYLKIIKDLDRLDLAEEVAILAEGYISRGIFHRKFIADAVHMALASFHKVDYLVPGISAISPMSANRPAYDSLTPPPDFSRPSSSRLNFWFTANLQTLDPFPTFYLLPTIATAW